MLPGVQQLVPKKQTKKHYTLEHSQCPEREEQAQQEKQLLLMQELVDNVDSNKTRGGKEIHYSTETTWGTKSHYFLCKISADKLKEKALLTEIQIRGWEDTWGNLQRLSCQT